MKLIKGQKPQTGTPALSHWEKDGERIEPEGYNVDYYFERGTGKYLGPDCYGVEPVFHDMAPDEVSEYLQQDTVT